MRLARVAALALFAIVSACAATARAADYNARAEYGVRWLPRATAPTNCTAGRTCSWVDASGNLLIGNSNASVKIPAVTATTKGDIAAYSGTAWGRVPVGTNNFCLVADSTQSLGVKWATCPSAGTATLAVAYANGASQTDSTLLLDGTRLGLRIFDNASPITGALFNVSSAAGATPYLYVERAYTWIGNEAKSTAGSRTLAIQPGAHTNLTASTEEYVLETDPAGTTWQWATGALATQRFYRLKPPTIAFVGASTVTTAATLYVDPPVAGTNATITNKLAAWFGGRVDVSNDSGYHLRIRNAANTISYLDVSASGFSSEGALALGAAVGNGWMYLSNDSPASGGTLQQVGPEIWQRGQAWDGGATRLIGSRLELFASATGASYTTQWNLKLDRGAANASPLSAFYDGTNAWIEASNVRPAGTDTLAVTSNVADGAAAVGAVLNNTTALNTAGAVFFKIQNAGTDKVLFRAASSTLVDMILSDGSGVWGTTGRTSGIQFFNSGVDISGGSSNRVRPAGDNTLTLGESARRWSNVWARQHNGVEQTIAASASITINPASGEMVRITLGATGITTVNGSAGNPGETITVCPIQDGTGGRTITGWSSGTNGFLLAGGAYTPTSTANKRDCLTFRWDTVAVKWVETARSMNL